MGKKPCPTCHAYICDKCDHSALFHFNNYCLQCKKECRGLERGKTIPIPDNVLEFEPPT